MWRFKWTLAIVLFSQQMDASDQIYFNRLSSEVSASAGVILPVDPGNGVVIDTNAYSVNGNSAVAAVGESAADSTGIGTVTGNASSMAAMNPAGQSLSSWSGIHLDSVLFSAPLGADESGYLAGIAWSASSGSAFHQIEAVDGYGAQIEAESGVLGNLDHSGAGSIFPAAGAADVTYAHASVGQFNVNVGGLDITAVTVGSGTYITVVDTETFNTAFYYDPGQSFSISFQTTAQTGDWLGINAWGNLFGSPPADPLNREIPDAFRNGAGLFGKLVPGGGMVVNNRIQTSNIGALLLGTGTSSPTQVHVTFASGAPVLIYQR